MIISPDFKIFPSEWLVLPFLEVFEDVTSKGKKIKKENYKKTGEVPVVDQGQKFFGGYTDDSNKVTGVELPAIVFGDHTKTFKYVEEDFAIGADGVKLLSPKVEADKKFLFFYLKQLKLEDAGYSRHFKFLKETFIPLPPLETQKKIAAVLEKADQLRKDCKQMEQELNSLAQSVFINMFGDPVTNQKGWEKSPLSSITDDFLGGKSLVAADDNNTEFTNRVLKISAVTSGEFKPTESKPLPNDYQPQDEHFVQVGDLLFSRANTTELVGATSMVFEEYNNLLLPDKLWRFIWNKEKPVSTVFIWQQLSSEAVRKEISKLSSGSGGSMKNISKGKLKTLPVILPPVELQEKFERVYMKLRAELQNNKQQVQFSEQAFNALMQKAFKGELNL